MDTQRIDSAGPIVIIGAGIGGLCAALALQRLGRQVRVFERAAELRAVGAGIVLAPNALNVLARLGLAEPALAAGTALDQMEIVDARGRPLTRSVDAARIKATYGFASCGITRSALYGLLLDQLSPGTVIAGRAFERAVSTAGHITAHFGDGSAVTAQLLIGADGARSRVRQQIFPTAALRDSGHVSYRGLAEFELPLEVRHRAQETWGDDLRLGVVPIGPGHVYWYSSSPAALMPETLSPAQAHERLLAGARSLSPLHVALLEATPAERLIRTHLMDLAPLPAWHDGRIVLLGDAAHATTPNLGQGGCQAIEDAYVLAQALDQHARLDEAFGWYERIRKARAELVVARSRQFGAMVHLPSAWQRAARNAVLRVIPPALNWRMFSEVYSVNY